MLTLRDPFALTIIVKCIRRTGEQFILRRWCALQAGITSHKWIVSRPFVIPPAGRGGVDWEQNVVEINGLHMHPLAICLKLFRQMARFPVTFARPKTGNSNAARMAVIAITTSISSRVNALGALVTVLISSIIRVHLGQNLIEFARSQIALHLFIPRILVPRMQAGGHIRPFFQAERLQRFFDLLNAHSGNLLRLRTKRKSFSSPPRLS